MQKIQNNNTEKITFKVVQMKSLAIILLIKNYVFIYLLLEIYKISSTNMTFTYYSNDFLHKINNYHFYP